MNVMKRAHELTIRRHNAKLLNGINPAPYKVLFAIALRDAHKEAKAMIEALPVEWYNVKGHVVCPDTGEHISVNEGSSKALTAADSILWYVRNFDKHCLTMVKYHEGGFISTEKPNSNYK